jgi:hypothetical protein
VSTSNDIIAFEKKWLELEIYVNLHYYKPDMEALRLLICVYITHYYYPSPPAWVCLVGPPGSGKTEIGLRPLESMANIHTVSELTTNSFLSGFGDKNGILDKLTPVPNDKGKTHGIIVFPDFTTTLLSKDQYTRNEIMGQMRRVYDGYFEKKTGNKDKMLQWKGKVTCIAAATPDIEEHWAVYRDMGERWLNLRWKGFDDTYETRKKVAEYADRQEGKEKEIREGLVKRIQDLIANISSGPQTATSNQELMATSILLEECRVNVKREFMGRGYQVMGLGNKQHSTRTPKTLGLIAKASACLRRDDKIEPIDIHLAKRIALDSIPSKRMAILDILLKIYPEIITKIELISATGMAVSSFERVLEDMRYLKLIDVTQSSKHRQEGIELDELNSDDVTNWETVPYYFTRPKKDAKIRLHKDIIPVLMDTKLL